MNQAIADGPRKFQAPFRFPWRPQADATLFITGTTGEGHGAGAPARAGNRCRGGPGEFRKRLAVESLLRPNLACNLMPEAGFDSPAIGHADGVVQADHRGETGVETVSLCHVRNIPGPWHAARRVFEGMHSRFNRSRQIHSAGLGELSTWQHHDG